MNNEIQLFHNDEFGDVRTLIIAGEPWFVAKDVAVALGYVKPRNAVSMHVEPEDKKDALIQGLLGGRQTMTILNESGVYSLILSSKLPSAKQFKRWVTSEILPSIRKTGGYRVDDATYLIDKFFPTASEPQRLFLHSALTEIETLNAQIIENQPKVEFADQVASTDSLIDMETMAKLARNNGISIGRNRLFEFLRDIGILIRSADPRRNLPYQEFLERGYFKVREKCYRKDGEYKVYYQTMITGKGQLYIIKRLRRDYRPEMYPPQL